MYFCPRRFSFNRRIVYGVLLTALSVYGQSQIAPTFDVASIKPSQSGENMDLHPYPGGRLSIRSLPLRRLIMVAFGVKDFQISGGPGWVNADRYDIEAKAGGDPDQKQMIGAMLQELLGSRFGLEVHHETKELPIYMLLVAKDGPKLADSGTCADASQGTPQRAATSQQAAAPCGRIQLLIQPTIARLDGTRVSMAQLVLNLTSILGRPVIDKTGLTSSFDVHLEVVPDESLAGLQSFGLNGDPNAPVRGTASDSASIFNELPSQLGLKLEAAKGPVEVLVIDHVERPSAN